MLSRFGISTKMRVRRFEWRAYGQPGSGYERWSGYCEDQGQYHLLEKLWVWRGIVIWKRVVDREDIPNHAWISAATIGDTNGWASRFQKYMIAAAPKHGEGE